MLTLFFAGMGLSFAQTAPAGTFSFTGQASNGAPYVITATITNVDGVSTMAYNETISGTAFCSSALSLTTTVSATHFVFTSAEITTDCSRGEEFHIYTDDPTFNQIVLKKADYKTYTLVKL